MRATQIERGDVLLLKRDNPYGFTADKLVVRVLEIRVRDGYKTPWIIDQEGQAFRPSDFAKAMDLG